MTLKETILADLKASMKEGNATKTTTLRGLISVLNNKAIEKRTKAALGGQAGKEETLTEDEALSALMTEAKKHKESIAVFTQGGRSDLADNEQKELAFIQVYLPTQLTKEEVEKMVTKIITELSSKEFGPAMKAVMAQLRGKADATLVTSIVKEKLS